MNVNEMVLDQTSGVPYHIQVEHLLRRLIREPEYQKGKKLPKETDLARELGISRNTVRQGISKLVFEGLLERRAGHGTHVVKQTTETGLSAWSSFSGEMAAKGVDVQTFNQSVIEVVAPPEVAAGLQIASDSRVILLDRVRGYDKTPAVWFRSWFHPRLGITKDQKFEIPLYSLVEQNFGVRAELSREEITAEAADKDVAARLRVKSGSPLLVRRRVVRDRNGSIIEYALNYYRPDRFNYAIEIKREQ